MKSDKKLLEAVKDFLGSEVGAELGPNFVSDEALSYGALKDFYGRKFSEKELSRAGLLLEASIDIFFKEVLTDDKKIFDRADKIHAKYMRVFR